MIQKACPPCPVKRIGYLVAKEARSNELPAIVQPATPGDVDRIVGGDRYQANHDARINAEQRRVRHRARPFQR
jgi:hypothetical protein